MLREFTEVYYAKVGDIDIEKLMKLLPKEKIEHIEKTYNVEKDKKMSIAAHLLLREVFKKHFVNIDKYEFIYMDNGMPCLVNTPIFFSLSHSGEYVAVAVSNNQCGVDIQEMKEVDLNCRKLVFNDEDERHYQDSSDKFNTFYKMWVSKEACYKFSNSTGKDLKTIDIENAIVFDELPGYKIAVASFNSKVKKFKKLSI